MYGLRKWVKARSEARNLLTSQCSNADLVRRLHKVAQHPGQRVIKVKAHVDPYSCDDDWTGFLQLGNQIADEAAKAAMRAIPGDLAGEARKIFASNKADKVKLAKVLEYTSRITLKYLQKCQTKADEDAGIEPHQTHTDKLILWKPADVRVLEFEVQTENIANYAWGTAFAQSACKWLNTLQWPVSKRASDPGITILELLINWMICTGNEQPIVVPHDGKGPYAIQTSQQNPAVALLPYPWPKRIIAFDLALRQLQKITTGHILPWEQKAEVKCLMKFGPKKPQKGFVRRPLMTFTHETLKCITKGLVNSSLKAAQVICTTTNIPAMSQ